MRNLHSPSSQNGQVQGLTLHFLIRYTVSYFPLSITSKFPYETENKRWQCIYTEREQSPQAATVTSIELIKSSSKFSARASSVMRSTQASLMSLHTECHLLPYMSPHQGTSALSHWFKALCSTQHGRPNQIYRLFFIEYCSQGNPKQIKRHHCTQIQHWGTVSWSRGMCFNSYFWYECMLCGLVSECR